MKKISGKLFKNLAFAIVTCFMFQCVCFAYETVLVSFPNDNWYRAFYENRTTESIVQYFPSGQAKDDFKESVVFHSYKWAFSKRDLVAKQVLAYLLSQSTMHYRDVSLTYLRNETNDAMAVWCSASASQCEIVRVSRGYEGIIAMHYINNNPQYFQSVSPTWINIIKNIRIYYSYYRWDTIMNKRYTVEL